MKIKNLLIITLLAFITPLITGYYFGLLDHHHYLPYLNKLINPSLYLSDYYFSQPHAAYSFFNYLIVFTYKFFNFSLAWTIFSFYFISLWLLYYAVFSLSYTLFKNKNASILAIIFLILPKWAAQIGYQTHHFYFISRDLSLSLGLLALNDILRKKKISSLVFIILSVLVNPSIPIPVFILWLYRFVLKSFLNKLPSLVLLPLNQSWVNTLKLRGTYSFPHLWKWTGWGNLVLFSSLYFSAKLYFKKQLFPKFNKIIKK